MICPLPQNYKIIFILNRNLLSILHYAKLVNLCLIKWFMKCILVRNHNMGSTSTSRKHIRGSLVNNQDQIRLYDFLMQTLDAGIILSFLFHLMAFSESSLLKIGDIRHLQRMCQNPLRLSLCCKSLLLRLVSCKKI